MTTGSVSPSRADTRRDHLARYMMTKRGLAEALSRARSTPGTLPAHAYVSIVGAVETLLKANIEAGTVRADVAPAVVVRGLAGLMLLDPHGNWRAEAT